MAPLLPSGKIGQGLNGVKDRTDHLWLPSTLATFCSLAIHPDPSPNNTHHPGPDHSAFKRSMLLSAVLLWLYLTSSATRAEALGFWGLPLALFRHVSQLEGRSSWLSRLGWGLGEAEVSIVVSIRIVGPGLLVSLVISSPFDDENSFARLDQCLRQYILLVCG